MSHPFKISLHFSLFLLLAVLFKIAFLGNAQNRYRELEILKPNQRQALAKFKRMVSPMLPHNWMKEDIYLVKFLSFNQFRIPKSVDHLKEMLKWRKDNNVDQAIKNPGYFADLQKDFPTYVDGHDKKDRPICESHTGNWPIRKAVLAGKSKKLVQHIIINCFERAEVKIREQQAKGKNVTQWIFLANAEGFSVPTHLCTPCVPVLVSIAAAIDKYYPNSPYGFWLPNTPDSFATLLRIVRPVLSPATRSIIKTFSSREADWKPFLEKRIDFNQISSWYGGTKERESVKLGTIRRYHST